MTTDTHTVVARGKTKTLIEIPDCPSEVEVINADDITAGDGARKDSFARKGEYSTETNDNVFRFLNACRVPTAYIERTGPNTFRAKKVRMLPYEAVCIFRAVAASSLRKREPHIRIGETFPLGRYALFLKTTDYAFGSMRFEKNDPFVIASGDDGIRVCRPDMPVGGGNSIIRIPPEVIFGPRGKPHPFDAMHSLANRVGVLLHQAWDRIGCTLCDFKLEFGLLPDGTLVVADVIDNDSWRLLDEKDQHLDKQRYRDGSSLEVVEALYRLVALRSKKLINAY